MAVASDVVFLPVGDGERFTAAFPGSAGATVAPGPDLDGSPRQHAAALYRRQHADNVLAGATCAVAVLAEQQRALVAEADAAVVVPRGPQPFGETGCIRKGTSVYGGPACRGGNDVGEQQHVLGSRGPGVADRTRGNPALG